MNELCNAVTVRVTNHGPATVGSTSAGEQLEACAVTKIGANVFCDQHQLVQRPLAETPGPYSRMPRNDASPPHLRPCQVADPFRTDPRRIAYCFRDEPVRLRRRLCAMR